MAADVATDTATARARPRRGNRYNRMRLPHERDESTQAAGAPNPVVQQGASDVAAGRVDTAGYDAVAQHYERKEDES